MPLDDEREVNQGSNDDLARGTAISLRRSLRDGQRRNRPEPVTEATALRAFDILRNLTRQ